VPMRWPRCCHVSSMLRLWAKRIQCLILAKACSMGFRSGEYLGRNQSLAPACLMVWRTAFDLWLPGLSAMTLSPGLRVGSRIWSA